MTEGNGHVIDPAGVARLALQAAVAEHGPSVLSDPGSMDRIGRESLAGLPGEAILIGSAARTDVPALLREQIPQLGNYGAIQSVAAALAEAHSLEPAACLWVVREFARALGLIAPGGTQTAAAGGPPGGRWSAGAGREEAVAGRPGGTGTPPGSPGGGGPQAPGPPGAPPPSAAPPSGLPPPGAPLPGAPRPGARRPGRNALGIAAAIALVIVYLGVAAVAHLSPFPAKAATSTSSRGGSQGAPGATPDASPDAAPDPSPPSAFQTLLRMIPGNVQGQDDCANAGTRAGATAVAECGKLQGLAATTIFYYLFSSQGALNSGFNSFLKSVNFTKGSASCTTASKVFADFVVQCQDGFTSTAPAMTGSIAEYTNSSNDPIIVSSDNQELVMAVMVGINDSDLLAYWKQLQWITTSG